MNKYKCELSHTTGCIKDLGRICPGCMNATWNRYKEMLLFIKSISKGVHAGSCYDLALNAQSLLKEIGEN